MKKVCTVSGKTFEITDEDVKFYEKMEVPIPTLCPEERMKRKLAWRRERQLYKRKCDATGKNLISIHSAAMKFPVYDAQYWWSNNWDILKTGRDFDFSHSFFEQFSKLQKVAPKMHIHENNNINCLYGNHIANSKNCYLMIASLDNEDCLYGSYVNDSRDSVDNTAIRGCELTFETIDCIGCYDIKFSQNCENCNSSWFLKDCIGCSSCFGCVNLRNKKYCFLNEQYNLDEYQKKINTLSLQSTESLITLQEKFFGFSQNFPKKYSELLKVENCTGNLIYNAKSCKNCFDVKNAEDCKYIWYGNTLKDCYDCYGAYPTTELCYESLGLGGDSYNCKFSYLPWSSSNIEYSINTLFCKYCVGCSDLHHKQYCILNKQYSKEEYFKLRDKIIEHMKVTGEWGEFFPIELSPFAYNETVAQEYFPMTKEEVLANGWKWRDEKRINKGACSLAEIPDNITDVPDSICTEILTCESCSKNYKIQKAELKFYQKQNLPIPHKCPDCRHSDRMKLRNPRKLWERKCDKCNAGIQTTFAPERPEKVYCEKCYLDSLE